MLVETTSSLLVKINKTGREYKPKPHMGLKQALQERK